jgi:hypothetical protein
MVYSCITKYIAVFVGILKIQKICMTRRSRTGYLLHSNQHTQLLRYERSCLGLNSKSRQYLYFSFSHKTLFHLVAGVERPAPVPPRRMRDTAPHLSPPPVAGGQAIDMIAMNVTTAINSVGTMDIIAYRATSAIDGWHERRPCAPRRP